MKVRNLALLVLSLGLSIPAIANDEHHPEKSASPSVATPSVALPAPATNASAKPLAANAAKIQAQAKRIAKTKPGPERDKLVAAHIHSLHESMEMAKGMMSGMDLENCPMLENMMGGKDMPGANPSGGSGERMEMMAPMMKGGMPKP